MARRRSRSEAEPVTPASALERLLLAGSRLSYKALQIAEQEHALTPRDREALTKARLEWDAARLDYHIVTEVTRG